MYFGLYDGNDGNDGSLSLPLHIYLVLYVWICMDLWYHMIYQPTYHNIFPALSYLPYLHTYIHTLHTCYPIGPPPPTCIWLCVATQQQQRPVILVNQQIADSGLSGAD